MSETSSSETDRGTQARERLWGALRPRPNRTQALVGLACLVLGFALATQVHSRHERGTLITARSDELVSILDTLSQRSERLRREIQRLERAEVQLQRDTQGRTAVEEARERARTYGVLAGTLPATGPGIELAINDPSGNVDATMLLDVTQELRDAGAEVIQINDVRVVASTYFLGSAGPRVMVDAHHLRPPYRFLVIGDSHTLVTALDIPGGVRDSLRNVGAKGVVIERDKVTVTALRSRSAHR